MTGRAVRRKIIAVPLIVALGVGAGALAATARLASLKPVSTICLGGTIKVGVRSKSSKRLGFVIKVVDPAGKVIFRKKGRVGKRWRKWPVKPARSGTHRVKYTLAGKRKSYGFQVNNCAPPVLLTDNDGGAASLTMSNAIPGQASSACLVVTYKGTGAGAVRLYGTTTGTGLASHLDLTLTRGTLPANPPFGSCTGFTADTADHTGNGPGVLYLGTVDGYPDDYSGGLVDPAAPTPESWTQNEAHAYRLEIEVQDDNAAQGKTAQQTFLWEVRG